MVATAIQVNTKTRNFFVKRTREECPENLSGLGRWMQENPNGIGVIVNRRAVNR